MKFFLTFKTPDAVSMLVAQKIEQYRKNYPCTNENCDKDKTEDMCVGCEELSNAIISLEEEMRECIEKFIQYNEMITIEFDTKTNTAMVVPVG